MTFVRSFLCAIGLLGTISAHAEPKIVEDAKGAATWVATALTSSGYKADFSVASLKEIDRFFDENAPNGMPTKAGLLSEHLGARLFAIGGYVGETIRRAYGGEWIGDDKDPQAEISISIRLKDGSIIWPMQRIMKRYKNGPEDGIFAYGVALRPR